MNHISGIFGLSFLLFCTLTFPSQAQNRVVDLAMGVSATIVGVEAGEAVRATSPGALRSEVKVISADVSGDGVSDVIIGLPFADDPDHTRSVAGRVYVVLGQRGLPPGSILDLQVDPPRVILFGAVAGDVFGSALAVGDVNGDRVKDIIIGAPLASEGNRREVGKVYIVYGGATLLASPRRDMAGSTAPGPDITMIGWGGADGLNADTMGTSVAAGDVNGDGFDDVIAGAPGNHGPDGRSRAGQAGIAPDSGAVFVFFGSANPPRVRDASMALPAGVNIAFYGRQANVRTQLPGVRIDYGDSAGTAVAVADVNMDGRADLIVGASNYSPGGNDDRLSVGAVYVAFGRQRSVSDPPLIFDVERRRTPAGSLPPDVSIFGVDTLDMIGSTLAAGDITGDMRADIIIPTADASGPNNSRLGSGEVYVIFGAAMLPATRDLTAGADFTVLGAEALDRLGFAVAVGNVNGDSVGDLIIGAPTADGPNNSRVSAGEIHVVFGRAGLTGTLDLAQSSPGADLTILGANLPDQFGSSVATEDVNGDGIADVISTAPFASSSGMTQQSRIGLTQITYGSR
jgi:hypothetical protein